MNEHPNPPAGNGAAQAGGWDRLGEIQLRDRNGAHAPPGFRPGVIVEVIAVLCTVAYFGAAAYLEPPADLNGLLRPFLIAMGMLAGAFAVAWLCWRLTRRSQWVGRLVIVVALLSVSAWQLQQAQVRREHNRLMADVDRAVQRGASLFAPYITHPVYSQKDVDATVDLMLTDLDAVLGRPGVAGSADGKQIAVVRRLMDERLTEDLKLMVAAERVRAVMVRRFRETVEPKGRQDTRERLKELREIAPAAYEGLQSWSKHVQQEAAKAQLQLSAAQRYALRVGTAERADASEVRLLPVLKDWKRSHLEFADAMEAVIQHLDDHEREWKIDERYGVIWDTQSHLDAFRVKVGHLLDLVDQAKRDHYRLQYELGERLNKRSAKNF